MKDIHVLPIEEQKQHIIDIMKADEELGLYKETLEEAVEKYGKQVADKYKNRIDLTYDEQIYLVGGNIVGFKEGAKWQEEQDKNKYSEEEVLAVLQNYCWYRIKEELNRLADEDTNTLTYIEWFEQNKKK